MKRVLSSVIAMLFLLLSVTLSSVYAYDSQHEDIDEQEVFQEDTLEFADGQILATGTNFTVTGEDVHSLKEHLESTTPFRTTQEQYLMFATRMKLFIAEGIERGYLEISDSEMESLDVKEMVNLKDIFIHNLLINHYISQKVIDSYYYSFPQRFLSPEVNDNDENIDHAEKGSPGQDHDQEQDAEKIDARDFADSGHEGIGDHRDDLDNIMNDEDQTAAKDAEKGTKPNMGFIDRSVPADRVIPLDDDLRKKIRAHLLSFLSKSIIEQEYQRLLEKYDVQFIQK